MYSHVYCSTYKGLPEPLSVLLLLLGKFGLLISCYGKINKLMLQVSLNSLDLPVA